MKDTERPDICIGCRNLRPLRPEEITEDGGQTYCCDAVAVFNEDGVCEQFEPHPYFEQDEDDGFPE